MDSSLMDLLSTIGTDSWAGPSPVALLAHACASHSKPPLIHATETNHECIIHHLGVRLSLSPRLSAEISSHQATELTAFLALLLVKGMCSFSSSSDVCCVYPCSSSGLSPSSQPHTHAPPTVPSSHRMIRGLGLIHEEPEEDDSLAAVADEVEGLGFRALGLKELPSDPHHSAHDKARKQATNPHSLSGEGNIAKREELMRRLERKRQKLEMKLAEIDAMKKSVMEGQGMVGVPISGSKRARVAGTGQDRLSGERSNSVNSLQAYTKSARVTSLQSGVRRESSFASPSDSEEEGESESSSLSSDAYDSEGGQGVVDDQGAAPSSSHVKGSNHPTPSSAAAPPPSSRPPPTNYPRHSFDPAYPSLPLSLDDEPEPPLQAASSQGRARAQSRSSSIHSSSLVAHSSHGDGRGDDKSKVQELKEMCDKMHWSHPLYYFTGSSASLFICEVSLPPLPLLTPSDQPKVVKSSPQMTKKAAKEQAAAFALQQILEYCRTDTHP